MPARLSMTRGGKAVASVMDILPQITVGYHNDERVREEMRLFRSLQSGISDVFQPRIRAKIARDPGPMRFGGIRTERNLIMSAGLNVSEPAVARTRAKIYYWKCDRASGLHNLAVANEGMAGEKLSQLQSFLRQIFTDFDLLKPAGGQGNHHSIEAGNLIRDRMAEAPLLERGFSQMAVDSDLARLRAGFLSAAGIRTPAQ